MGKYLVDAMHGCIARRSSSDVIDPRRRWRGFAATVRAAKVDDGRSQHRADRNEIPPTAGLPPRWRDLVAFGDGPTPPDLAAALAAFLDTDHVQLECSGTAALIVALTALKRISDRRVVVVPAYTCPLVALAVAHSGLEPRLCDLAPGSIDFGAEQLARVVDGDTLAVMPTHLAGRVADVATAARIARDAGAFVIEDAAQALGAMRGGAAVGFAGDVGFFSLAVGKGLTTFEGGVLVARDRALRDALRQAHDDIVPRRLDWELRRSVELIAYHALYRPRTLALAYGRPLRRALRNGDPIAAVGDDFSSAIPVHALGAWRQRVGARAFTRLPAFLAACRARALVRKTRLARIEGVEAIDDAADAGGTWPFLLLRMPSEHARDVALDQLWASGLGVSRLFVHALPDYGYLASIVADADIPNARAFAATTLTVSNSPWLDDETFEAICAVLESTTRNIAR